MGEEEEGAGDGRGGARGARGGARGAGNNGGAPEISRRPGTGGAGKYPGGRAPRAPVAAAAVAGGARWARAAAGPPGGGGLNLGPHAAAGGAT